MKNEESRQNETSYDLFSPHFKRDPFPTFAAMRRDAPVYMHEMPGGRRVWYISRYEDVVEVLKDNERFVKDYRNAVPAEDLPDSYRKRGVQQQINQNMLFSDPPDHTRLRALITRAFTPRRVEAMRPRIQAVAEELVEAVYSAGKMDLIADYAFPLPAIVIMELLGVPPADRDRVREWTQALISPGGHNIRFGERKRRLRAFVRYLDEQFEARRRQQADDLLTDLVQTEESGDSLSDTELSSMVALLLVTGHETVINLIGNAVYNLLLHPQPLARALADPAEMEKAVEELLRYDGPVETSTTRWAARDFQFRGQQLRRGDIVRVVITSANRDPAQFEQPDVLNIDRPDNRHLSFGLGIHYCLGAPLARLEGTIALTTLWRRLPKLRLAEPAESLEWQSGVLFRGLKELPLTWEVP